MAISQYVLCFFLYAFAGWLWETLFCTIKSRRWANRGFLYGPVCPLYGTGGVAMQLLIQLISALSGGRDVTDFAWWQVFLFCLVVCTVLEYFTHWLLEKLFHAYWWDYTNMPLNLNGRICLPASLVFGAAGVLLVYVILPRTDSLFSSAPGLLVEGLSLVLIFLLGMDVALTVSALTDFEKKVTAMQENIAQHMEQFVASLPGGHTGTEAAMATEREAYTRKSTEELMQNMRALGRSSIQRVKTYRPRKPDRKQKHTPELRLRREQVDQLRIQVQTYMNTEREKARERQRQQKQRRKEQEQQRKEQLKTWKEQQKKR